MSDCPYFDTSHSMADLYYVCKTGRRPRKINSKDINKHPCLMDTYAHCRHYPERKRAKKIK